MRFLWTNANKKEINNNLTVYETCHDPHNLFMDGRYSAHCNLKNMLNIIVIKHVGSHAQERHYCMALLIAKNVAIKWLSNTKQGRSINVML